MARFLVLALSAVSADPVKNAEQCFKKGDIVRAEEAGHEWGGKEGLPTFVHVDCSEVTLAQVEQYTGNWQRQIGWEIVGTDPVLDGARVRVFTLLPGAANQYGLTRQQVEAWLNNWGATVVNVDTNEVRFDVTIAALYQSEGFWDANPADHNIIVTETNYDQPTGVHTVEIDAIGSPIAINEITDRVESAGAQIIEITGPVIIAEFYRNVVRSHFQEAVAEQLDRMVRQRRYYISEADVDAVVAAGGQLDVTLAQLQGQVLDKAL